MKKRKTDFKLDFRAIGIKTAPYWHKNPQSNEAEDPDVSSCNYGYLIRIKCQKHMLEQSAFSANGVGNTACRRVKRCYP